MRNQVTYIRRYMLQPVRRCCGGQWIWPLEQKTLGAESIYLGK